MTIQDAKRIIWANENCCDESFIFFLHEKDSFSKEGFWKFYKSIVALVECNDEKTLELTEQINDIYQTFLKYIAFHFDPHNLSSIKDLPDNYVDYLERLDYALMAYYRGNPRLVEKDDIFELPMDS